MFLVTWMHARLNLVCVINVLFRFDRCLADDAPDYYKNREAAFHLVFHTHFLN